MADALVHGAIKGSIYARVENAVMAGAKVERATIKRVAPELLESYDATKQASREYGELLTQTKDLKRH